MKVLHISTSDRSGGAAIAAFRLNKAMSERGIDSNMLVVDKCSQEQNVISILRPIEKIKYNVLYYLSLFFHIKVLKCSSSFSLGVLGMKVSSMQKVKEADIIYIHWVNNAFLSLKELCFLLNLNKPIIFFMHDMWLLTGGCHHSFKCNNYYTQCKNCPNIANPLFRDIVKYVFNRKKCYLTKRRNLYIVTPSGWLSKCVNESALFKNNEVVTIPNLVDLQVFKPMPKELARKILNLPLECNLLLFGADSGHKNPYKGWSLLMNSLSDVNLDNTEIVVLGSKLDTFSEALLPCKVHSVGALRDEYSLTLLYNAIDVFVTPSLAESFGLTILEALSCATPVVAFNVGGIPDLVKHYQTGYLAEYKNVHDFAIGIEWCISRKNDEKWLMEIRNFVISHFSSESIINRHICFWEKSLIDGGRL